MTSHTELKKEKFGAGLGPNRLCPHHEQEATADVTEPCAPLLSCDVAFFHTHDARQRTVISMAGGAKTPQYTVRFARIINRAISLRAMTATAPQADLPQQSL